MRLIAIIAALLAGCAPAFAGDLRFEALGGQCQYTPTGSGVWFNEKYPYSLDMNASCAMIAVSKISDGRGWRAAYVDLGRAHSDAIFPMVEEEQALAAFSGSNCDPKTRSGCLGRGVGEQRARGFSLGFVEERAFGNVIAGLDLGGFIYEGIWRIQQDADGQWSLGHHADERFRGIQFTPYLGITARYGYLSAMLRIYGRIKAAEHGNGNSAGVASGSLTQMLIGLSVPF